MFLTVLIILGIIVAGGFLIYFVADIVMSLANKNKDADVISQKQERERKQLVERIEALENKEELKQDPEIKELLYKGAEVESFDIYAEEQKEEAEEVQETEENETTEEAEEEAEEDLSAEIARRKQALMERLAILQEQKDIDEQEEEEEAEEETSEETEVEETKVEETEVEKAEVEETKVEEKEEIKVEETAEEIAQEETPNVLASTYTKDELLAKLAEAQEKLKANEKDLRASKKEYIPLRRVKKTLEKDENKLRRKEALVAKQEVLLHGVNNYADIDEEKAKKLAEDLDLLDGLKLSVQHCHEVMDKNKERYPLLEKIYNLLVSQNAEIKANIKNLQEAIASLDKKDEE